MIEFTLPRTKRLVHSSAEYDVLVLEEMKEVTRLRGDVMSQE